MQTLLNILNDRSYESSQNLAVLKTPIRFDETFSHLEVLTETKMNAYDDTIF